LSLLGPGVSEALIIIMTTKRSSCPSICRYRVNFRPRYVTRYKTVTQLEWRCCPGFRGADCQEGPKDLKKTPRPTPARPRNSVKKATGNMSLVLCKYGHLSYFQCCVRGKDLGCTKLSSDSRNLFAEAKAIGRQRFLQVNCFVRTNL
jgi:hypothetical protein